MLGIADEIPQKAQTPVGTGPRPEDEGLVQALLRRDAHPPGVAEFLLRDDDDGPARLWWVAGQLWRRGVMRGSPDGQIQRCGEAVREILQEYVRQRPDLAARQLVDLVGSDDWTEWGPR